MFELGLLLSRQSLKEVPGIGFDIPDRRINEFIGTLPFELTSAQNRSFDEIKSDMCQPVPMNRLLQGDVGSGKTMIANLSALIAIFNGYQAALMVPTEILAEQHFSKISKYLKDHKVKLLTGTTQKKEKTKKIDDADLIIGTHAIIEDDIEFRKLGLVIIDEQHRFGVVQRSKLLGKGKHPDLLYMTATPIPRSLALTIYGDLDHSIIDELPPGRIPIRTNYVPPPKRHSAYEFIRSKINEGQQVFIICPLVEETEKSDLKAAVEEADYLQKEIFAEFRVGLIHGRLKGSEKERVMNEFRDGKIQLLVSTTVIEVGIDIPNATIMMIEHAERFGLSQLHQLRGRVGRGAKESFCFLFGEPKTHESKMRIKTMVESSDGFHIAEADLKLRGPGEAFGTRQAGLPEFLLAEIVRDEELLKLARIAALELIASEKEVAQKAWESSGKSSLNLVQ